MRDAFARTPSKKEQPAQGGRRLFRGRTGGGRPVRGGSEHLQAKCEAVRRPQVRRG